MPTSLPMLPMAQEWQGKPAYRKCSRIPKESLASGERGMVDGIYQRLSVHRLDRSIDYVKDRAKTTKSAGSLEEAIDYALNREKTEQTIFEDAMGCTCENAYVDMVKTKERFHKKDGVQGYHLVQSFAEGEASPELAHLIGQELAEQLLKGQYKVVITTI